MARNFREMLEKQWDKGNFVCVGLDPDINKLPGPWRFRHTEYSAQTFTGQVGGFLLSIVKQTRNLVCAYKPNSAFFEAHGEDGWKCLNYLIHRIHEIALDVPVILDAKRADIGNTNVGYVKAIFDDLGADAVTVHPYLGSEALAPFLERKDKGLFVLCRTSNPGAGEFQDLPVVYSRDGLGLITRPLYKIVAEEVARKWNKNGNCGLVVGATYPGELADVRMIAGDIPILIPGVGAQGGDLEKSVRFGKDSRGRGFLVNSSRGIIFASSGDDFAEAARRETEKLHTLINQYREAQKVGA